MAGTGVAGASVEVLTDRVPHPTNKPTESRSNKQAEANFFIVFHPFSVVAASNLIVTVRLAPSKSGSPQLRPLVTLLGFLRPVALATPTPDRDRIHAGTFEFLIGDGAIFLACCQRRVVFSDQAIQRSAFFCLLLNHANLAEDNYSRVYSICIELRPD